MNHLFIENQPYSLFRNDGTAKFYEERCLPMVCNGDIVVTSYPIDKSYIDYLDTLGIPQHCTFLTPSVHSTDLASSTLQDKTLLKYIDSRTRDNNWTIETFLPNKSLESISKILNIPLSFPMQIYKKYGSKSGFRKLAEDVGLPIPSGMIITKKDKDVGLSFFKEYKEVVIKYDNTIDGRGVFFVKSEADLIEKIMKSIRYKIIIEEKIHPEKHGSIQIIIKDGKYHIVQDECIIENMQFKGFRYPFLYKKEILNDFGEKVARFLINKGMRNGFFGLDFMISNNTVYFHDFNPRKTGVSYVLFFIKKIYGERIRLADIGLISEYHYLPKSTNYSFNKIIKKIEKLLIEHNKEEEGILLFNPSLLSFNILHVISVSFCGSQKEYIESVKKILIQ